MNLTTTQRMAIRQINDQNELETINKRTMNSLVKRGLVTDGSLTPAGKRAHQRIMSTGNGPEGLKAMFRF